LQKKITIDSSCELPPLTTEVKINGLYVFLLETNIVMDMMILEKLEKTMVLLMKMEIEVALGNMLVYAFG
jgi:hypothetical protein